MCLSRLLDDAMETDEYKKGATIKIEIDFTHLTERHTQVPGKRVVRLRGVVPFEIAKWKMKETLKIIDTY